MNINSSRLYNIVVCAICAFIFMLAILILIATRQSRNVDEQAPIFKVPTIIRVSTEDNYISNNCDYSIRAPRKLKNADTEVVSETSQERTEVMIGSLLSSSPEVLNGENLSDVLGLKHTVSPRVYQLTEAELKNIATIVQLEVIGASSALFDFADTTTKYWEMCAVAQCIRNRVEDSRFPNSIDGVIFASHKSGGRTIYQFSPAETLNNYTPTHEAILAAKEVFERGVTVMPKNYLYFCASSIESRFERINSSCLLKNLDGTYEKIQGHLTTFYAGTNGR